MKHSLSTILVLLLSVGCDIAPKAESKEASAPQTDAASAQSAEPARTTPLPSPRGSLTITAKEPGELEAAVLVSDVSGFDFFDVWKKAATPTGHTVETIQRTTRGQKLGIKVAITGFTQDDESMTHWLIGMKIVGPDGTMVLDDPHWEESSTLTAETRKTMLSGASTSLTFDDTDPLGTYRISTVVKDKLTGKTYSNSTTLTLADN